MLGPLYFSGPRRWCAAELGVCGAGPRRGAGPCIAFETEKDGILEVLFGDLSRPLPPEEALPAACLDEPALLPIDHGARAPLCHCTGPGSLVELFGTWHHSQAPGMNCRPLAVRQGEEDTGAAAPKSSRSASTGSEELEETITAGGLEAPRPATEGVVEKPPPRALEVETATAAGSQGETPEETANVLSKIFFCYANRILWLGTKKQLQFKDLWEISKVTEAARRSCFCYLPHFKPALHFQGDEAAQLHSAFTSHLESTKCSSSPYGRVWGGLYRTFGKAYAIAALIKAVWVVVRFLADHRYCAAHLIPHGSRNRSVCCGVQVQFAGPLLLEALLANMESVSCSCRTRLPTQFCRLALGLSAVSSPVPLLQATGTHWRTLGLAAGMLCASILEMILQNIHFHMGFRMGMHIKVRLENRTRALVVDLDV